MFVKRKKFEDLFTKPSSPALATRAPRGSSRLARTKFVFGLQVLVPEILSLQEVVPKSNLSARCGTKSVISSQINWLRILCPTYSKSRGRLAPARCRCFLIVWLQLPLSSLYTVHPTNSPASPATILTRLRASLIGA
jgi:hypothetical protein